MTRRRISAIVAAIAFGAPALAHAADTPQQVYAHKDAQSVRGAAVAAGVRAGLSPKRVADDIDKGRDQLPAATHQPDRAKAKKAENDLGGQLFACGLEGLKSGEIKSQ